jgi:hypothetical protein
VKRITNDPDIVQQLSPRDCTARLEGALLAVLPIPDEPIVGRISDNRRTSQFCQGFSHAPKEIRVGTINNFDERRTSAVPASIC